MGVASGRGKGRKRVSGKGDSKKGGNGVGKEVNA